MDEAVTGSEQEGYRAPQVCHLIGITYRQLDYWARTDLLKPSLRAASGSGTQRLYSFTDLVQLKVIKRLLDTGINLPKIRKAIEWLSSDMAIDHPLRDATLLSDGNDIWTSDNSDETHHYLMDILKKGQGVFAIAVGQVQRDLEGESLKLFPPASFPTNKAQLTKRRHPDRSGGHRVLRVHRNHRFRPRERTASSQIAGLLRDQMGVRTALIPCPMGRRRSPGQAVHTGFLPS